MMLSSFSRLDVSEDRTDDVIFGVTVNVAVEQRLESTVVLEVSSDISDESLEGMLADEELSGFLELSDFSESGSFIGQYVSGSN